MPSFRTILAFRATPAIVLCGLLGACAKQEDIPAAQNAPSADANPELQWARSALERNPHLKVLSVDTDRNTIKVFVKSTGETTNVAPGELAAIPIGDLVALNAAKQEAAIPARPPVVEETIPVAPTPQAEPPAGERTANYKVEYQDGRTRITGPGVNVESATSAPNNAPPTARRFDDPIICEGKRMLHLDRRRLNVDGDAIVARGGCELHITNSQITATGTAVTVQDAAVHVSNSTVRGSSASIDVQASAKFHSLNSQFFGLVRRDPQAGFNDQGGNAWRQ